MTTVTRRGRVGTSPTDSAGPDRSTPPAGQVRPGRHTARWVAIGVLVITAGLVAVLATRPVGHRGGRARWSARWPRPSGANARRQPVHACPPWPGKFVVVSFFASWCAQCQDEGPELVKFQFQHQQRDATVVSVVFSDSQSSARASQALLGVTWPTLVDAGGTMALDFGVKELPSTFLIAPDGRVVASFTAPVTAPELDQYMAKATAEHA